MNIKKVVFLLLSILPISSCIASDEIKKTITSVLFQQHSSIMPAILIDAEQPESTLGTVLMLNELKKYIEEYARVSISNEATNKQFAVHFNLYQASVNEQLVNGIAKKIKAIQGHVEHQAKTITQGFSNFNNIALNNTSISLPQRGFTRFFSYATKNRNRFEYMITELGDLYRELINLCNLIAVANILDTDKIDISAINGPDNAYKDIIAKITTKINNAETIKTNNTTAIQNIIRTMPNQFMTQLNNGMKEKTWNTYIGFARTALNQVKAVLENIDKIDKSMPWDLIKIKKIKPKILAEHAQFKTLLGDQVENTIKNIEKLNQYEQLVNDLKSLIEKLNTDAVKDNITNAMTAVINGIKAIDSTYTPSTPDIESPQKTTQINEQNTKLTEKVKKLEAEKQETEKKLQTTQNDLKKEQAKQDSKKYDTLLQEKKELKAKNKELQKQVDTASKNVIKEIKKLTTLKEEIKGENNIDAIKKKIQEYSVHQPEESFKEESL